MNWLPISHKLISSSDSKKKIHDEVLEKVGKWPRTFSYNIIKRNRRCFTSWKLLTPLRRKYGYGRGLESGWPTITLLLEIVWINFVGYYFSLSCVSRIICKSKFHLFWVGYNELPLSFGAYWRSNLRWTFREIVENPNIFSSERTDEMNP